MIRAFIAVELPTAVRGALARACADLSRLQLSGRCVNPGSIHLTLKFLGGIDPQDALAIGHALSEVARGLSPFQLSLRRMGVFPDLTRPRVVWFGVADSEPLTRLQRMVEESLAPLGLAPEKRPFKPHLTLMRLKSDKNAATLARYLRETGWEAEGGEFQVEEFHLYQSVLKPGGAEYRKMATFRLGAAHPSDQPPPL